MPGYDRTGPMGAGPMTGGARGRCNPATAGTIPASAGIHSYGRGLASRRGFRGGFDPGMGRGRGFGRGHRWYPSTVGPVYPTDSPSEMDMLKADADYMQKSLPELHSPISFFLR
jgi:hypothetical protein